jgi:hypothetical protein
MRTSNVCSSNDHFSDYHNPHMRTAVRSRTTSQSHTLNTPNLTTSHHTTTATATTTITTVTATTTTTTMATTTTHITPTGSLCLHTLLGSYVQVARSNAVFMADLLQARLADPHFERPIGPLLHQSFGSMIDIYLRCVAHILVTEIQRSALSLLYILHVLFSFTCTSLFLSSCATFCPRLAHHPNLQTIPS